MAVYIKMPLGTEVGLSPGDIVLDADLPLQKKGGIKKQNFSKQKNFSKQNFWPMSIVVKQSPISGTAELLFYHTMEGRSQPSHCNEDVQ